MRNYFVLILCLIPSFCYGQDFVNSDGSSLYPSLGAGNYIPPSSDYAILQWRLEPAITTSSLRHVTSAKIISRFDYTSGVGSTGLGWYVNSGDDYTLIYTVIDSTSFYYRSGNGAAARYLSEIQALLSSQGLGTVEQRRAFIAGFNVQNVPILDLSSVFSDISTLLGPWAKIGVGFMIALFCIELGFRNTKQLAGEAAKVARSAERSEINRQIRNDANAQIYKASLRTLAQIKMGSITVDGISPAKARRMFEETARDYAAYKKSKGWVR